MNLDQLGLQIYNYYLRYIALFKGVASQIYVLNLSDIDQLALFAFVFRSLRVHNFFDRFQKTYNASLIRRRRPAFYADHCIACLDSSAAIKHRVETSDI